MQIPLLPYKLFCLHPPKPPLKPCPITEDLPFPSQVHFFSPVLSGWSRSLPAVEHVGTSASAYIKLFSLRRMRPSRRDWPNYQQCMRELYTTMQTLSTSEPPKRHNRHFHFRFKKETYSSHFPQVHTYWLKLFSRKEVAMLTLRPKTFIWHSISCVFHIFLCFISSGTHPEECQVLHLLRGLSFCGLWWLVTASCFLVRK